MRELSILEALAEIKLIQNKINKKRAFISENLVRPASRVDPLVDDKGNSSPRMVAESLQAIHDLEENVVAIRQAINTANQKNVMAVGNTTRTVAEWLTWKRDVLPERRAFLEQLSKRIYVVRNQQAGAKMMGNQLVPGEDVIVHLVEADLAKDIEGIQEIADKLDGLLSLNDARILIQVP